MKAHGKKIEVTPNKAPPRLEIVELGKTNTPRYAVKENMGPGQACWMAKPSRKSRGET